MDTTRLYDIRPQPRTVADAALEGCYRVFMSQAALDAEKLKQGDWVVMHNHNNGDSGLGIAWRVQEANMKRDCIKIHDALRTSYGFELKDKLTVSKFTGELTKATKVIISDVTEEVKGTSGTGELKEELEYCAAQALYSSEALAQCFVFSATPRSGPNKAGRKRKFLIESIRSDSASVQMRPQVPYFFSRETEVELRDPTAAVPQSTSVGPVELDLVTRRLFGLERQAKRLNTVVKRVQKGPKVNLPMVLLHGSMCTGKTQVAKALQELAWGRTHFFRCGNYAGSAVKLQATCTTIFAEAIKAQPSLIIFDELEKVASSQKEDFESFVNFLAEQIEDLEGKRVLVVATTQKPTDLHSKVLAQFSTQISFPIPTEQVRFQILHAQLGGYLKCDATVLQRIAGRTPAFTAMDLRKLCTNADERAFERSLTPQTSPLEQSLVSNEKSKCASDNDEETNSGMIELYEEDFSFALENVHASIMNEAYVEVPKIYWTDIGGSEAIRRKLDDVLGLPLQMPEIFGQFNVPLATGILLYGPPGCSKTLTAKAVATGYGRNFIAVKGPELISKYVGESEAKIRDVFQKARDAAPAVIFFDEVDSLAPARDSGFGHEGLNTVATLLNEMDGIEKSQGVFVLAATNRPEAIDHALLRPGRLGTAVYIGPPNLEARQQIVTKEVKARNPADNLDVVELARRTDGYSGADVVELCRLATYALIREISNDKDHNITQLEMRHFEAAFGDLKPILSPELVAQLEKWSVSGVKKV